MVSSIDRGFVPDQSWHHRTPCLPARHDRHFPRKRKNDSTTDEWPESPERGESHVSLTSTVMGQSNVAAQKKTSFLLAWIEL